MREIALLMAVYEFNLLAVHIGTKENKIPDILSRWALNGKYENEFKNVTLGMDLKEILIDESYFVLSDSI
jgi:hypothetical protein